MKRVGRFGVAVGLVLFSGSGYFAVSRQSVAPEAIQSSVIQRSELIDRAWRLPVATTFRMEITWQSNGSRCGPASVANTFRSLDEQKTTETLVLEGTGKCWTGICFMGLTLDELADVARAKTRRRITVLRNLTGEEFREHMKRSNDPGRRYIVNFARDKIFGAGVGHFSPIGGYLKDEDLVFVLDVNEHYKPWLIQRQRLFSAMDTLDGDKKRGLLLIEDN
ncbi:phytochelatin synthase [Bradyrhizobium nanningense]|uniref:glutathione gamma-glutamylcysteinyltransferase n=1 Tax=Bradyrhizobium nanningense TaxID=1325118 RepID=A0A4Q0S0B5_9BRAD|nr:phytochelatin synthase family protein [Bradyrhizobium nanningense]RXH26283.1 phytochelatin synthase [Bradyrhizobium nanningense]RXH29517.1 phytochelatin synthase [Bradyrhizobium nanningense]